jgi:uncharacterized membrane protein
MKENNIPFIYISNELNKETYKSSLILGNITINLTQSFNWFQRLLIKLIFGFKIERININEKNM